jgi:hypothetical protein
VCKILRNKKDGAANSINVIPLAGYKRCGRVDVQYRAKIKEAIENYKPLRVTEISALDQTNTMCCYARSDKYWITDPQGIAWETFHTLDSAPVYDESLQVKQTACCGPTPKTSQPANSSTCCP